MPLLPILALAPAAGGGLFLVTDAVHPAIESYVRAGSGLRRVSRVPFFAGPSSSLAGVDERRRLAFVLTVGKDGKPGSFAAFRYDARGRLSRGAVTPAERAAGAIAFSPAGDYAAVLSESGAKTYHVGADGALRPLDRKALYGGTGDAVVAVTSGDGRRLFRLGYGAYSGDDWSYLRAYDWRRDGNLVARDFADQWDRENLWGRQTYTHVLPERHGRFAYGVGRAVLRLEAGSKIRNRAILRRDYDTGARDDERRGIYLVGKGRVDWAADGALGQPWTLGHIGTPTDYASLCRYDPRRGELSIGTVDSDGSHLGFYRVIGGRRLVRVLEANLGKDRNAAVWVPR